MKSMTGFGYGEYQDERIQLSLEIKSYNNRYLDISVNLPPIISPLEQRVREYLSERVNRGRVDVYVKIRDLQESVRVSLDRGTVNGYLTALHELAALADVKEGVTLSHLLQLEGVFSVEKRRDIEEYWELLQPLLESTFAEFDASRAREGASTLADIRDQISRIERQVAVIEAHAPGLEEQIKSGLRERFQEVMGNTVDENRLYAETAVLLVRYSINEELVRMRTHLSSFLQTIESNTAGRGIGKKLDFVCQELNREINTTGSKSIMIEINQAAIEVKDALENVREQLRNVE